VSYSPVKVHWWEQKSMSVSQTLKQFSFAFDDSGNIKGTERAYFSQRLRNRVRGILLERFFEAQDAGLTKAELARRIDRPPEMVHRWLAAPRNLTLDTMCELLLGISGEEFMLTTAPIRLAQPHDQPASIEAASS
jgi:plasmid maintenance system antidote protein VapI